jgi:hypothetical protein
LSQVIIKNVQVNNVSKGKASWQVAEITYSANGETKHGKVMSFGDGAPAFANLKDMKEGDTAELVWKKNDSTGYMNIVDAKKVEGSAKTATSTAPRSNYETPEERAYRQVLIVRQSCLAQAVASMDSGTDVNEIMDRAQEFVDWVMSVNDTPEV